MLKSQLQTTNFSTNFLSELPDELQELIYRKVCMFVINELNALVKVANEVGHDYRHPPVMAFYKHPVINNLPLNKAMKAIDTVRLLNKNHFTDFYTPFHRYLYTYNYGGVKTAYDTTRGYYETYHCPDLIFGAGLEKIYGSAFQGYFYNKNNMFTVLQANNIKYYKSWTKLKLYKALMSY